MRLWQIGNETSYDRNGFDCETAAKRTVEFARAMRKEDPAIQLIGWGDSGWAKRMLEIAGEHLQYLAFHHMFNPDGNTARLAAARSRVPQGPGPDLGAPDECSPGPRRPHPPDARAGRGLATSRWP